MPMADENQGPGPSEPFGGLLVKLKPTFGGKIYLIPQSSLPEFEFKPQEGSSFNNSLNGKLQNLDYAIYAPDFIVYGSAG
jgi:hypothetical protein